MRLIPNRRETSVTSPLDARQPISFPHFFHFDCVRARGNIISFSSASYHRFWVMCRPRAVKPSECTHLHGRLSNLHTPKWQADRHELIRNRRCEQIPIVTRTDNHQNARVVCFAGLACHVEMWESGQVWKRRRGDKLQLHCYTPYELANCYCRPYQVRAPRRRE